MRPERPKGRKPLPLEGPPSLLAGLTCSRSASLFFAVARTKELFDAGPHNLLGYAAAGSAAWGIATLAESPIDFYKSQMQKQLILARAVRGRGLAHGG